MSQLIRRFPVSAYCFLALAIASLTVWVIFGNPTLVPAYLNWEQINGTYPTILETFRFAWADNRPLALVINVFAAAPDLAAIAVATILGRDALGRLLRSLRVSPEGNLRRSALVYAIIGAAIVGGTLALLALVREPRQAASLLALLGGSTAALVLFSLAYALFDIGGLSEELGWRGFVLRRLLGDGWPALDAALLIGVLWAGWHLPRDVVTVLGRQGLGAFTHYELVFVPTCVLVSVIGVLACNLTGGSIWPAVLIHGCDNLWGTLGDAAFGDRWAVIYLGVVLVIALACAARFGRSLGAKPAAVRTFRVVTPRSD